MIRTRKSLLPLVLLLLASGIVLTSCGKKSLYGKIIITESSGSQGKPDYVTGASWRYTVQSRLVAIDPGNPGKQAEILTSDFFSACSPEISFDGKHMIFAAQKKQNDSWQIWEMNLNNLKTRQVTNTPENSIDPAYMPGDRIVFSKLPVNDPLKAGHTLFTCSLAGTDVKRVTFNPHAYFASSVLKDGRIISVSRCVYPAEGEPSFMVLRPDGTKAELFYKGTDGSQILSRGRETDDGKLIFIESENTSKTGGSLVSVSYNRPLHSRIDLSAHINGDFCAAFPRNPGRLIVSFRSSENEKYALYDFDTEKMVLGDLLYKSADNDLLEAVVVTAHERPRKLPSEVDMGVKTGLLLCQDINVSGMTTPEVINSFRGADRVEIIGIDSSLGVVKVKKDGSFYLKVTADIPFRLKTLNSKGEVMNGPGSWIWMRPNERRGCVGCHEDQEMVPANRFALAVKNDPVGVPVHISNIKEKEVELE